MSRILYISNIGGKKITGSFSGTAISAAHNLNLDFYIVANRTKTTEQQMEEDQQKFGIKLLHADISRNPLSITNYTAYKQILSIIQTEHIDFIHCNTPTGGLLGRLVGRKTGIKTIYQVHGFHFFKGANLKNWILYYPIERLLAHYTDAVITINHEDYDRAKKFKLRNHGRVYYVPGVGINTTNYNPYNFDRQKKRDELGINNDDIVVISAGDLIKRKNYKTAIKAISHTNNKKIHYFICGQGPQKEELEKLAHQLGVDNQIHFLGFRTDVKELFWAADIFLFTTFQEGLPRSLSEAMASGLPCIVSKIRGNIDIIEDNDCGYVIEPNDIEGFTRSLNELANNTELRLKMGSRAKDRIKDFSDEIVAGELEEIYRKEIIDNRKLQHE